MYYTLSHLKRLVDALTPSQRTYLWANSPAVGRGNLPLYLRLYREIADGQTELSDVLKDVSSEARKSAKTRLRSHILQSLTSYYRDQTSDISIPDLFAQIAVLFELNLRDEALDLLTKLRSLARKHERFGFLLEVLTWEKRLNIVLDNPTRETMDILSEERMLLENISQLIALEQLYGRAKELKKLYGYVAGEQLALVRSQTIGAPGMPELKDCVSERAKHLYHFIYALYYWMAVDPSKGYQHSKQLSGSPRAAIPPADYVNGILENVTSCVCLGHFDDAISWLGSAEAFMEQYRLNQSQAFRTRIASYNMVYLLEIYCYMGDKVRLRQSIARTENDIRQYQPFLPMETLHVVKANLMNAYLAMGDLDNAQRMWDGLFNKKSKKLRPDVYDDLYLFRLFMTIQQGINEVVSSIARSALRYYQSYPDHVQRYGFQSSIIRLFRHPDALASEKDRHRTLKSARARLTAQIKKQGTSRYQERFSFYSIWIESLLQKTSFLEAAAVWYKDFRPV